jgi:Tfp pilus assembly protein PilE
MQKKRWAFSFVELIIVVAFLGAFALIAVPRFNYAIISRQKADTVARKIVTDMRYTRRLAISDAANNTQGFEFKMVGSVPYKTYEIENIKTKDTVASCTVDSSITLGLPSGLRFLYGPLGNLKPGSANQMTVSAEGKIFTITINSATGTIKCVEN